MLVKIFSKSGCPFCELAKRWFVNHNIKFIEVKYDNDAQRQAFYESVGQGVSTVPQIYINDKRIGGYQELINNADEILSNIVDLNSDF